MSRYRSYSRSPSRSRSRSPRRDSSRSSRSYRGGGSSRRDDDNCSRVHVGDLGIDCSRREIEKAFAKYGKLYEVWVARNPPCFAFVVFKRSSDAEEAVHDMDGRMLCGGRVRVSLARPRTQGRGRRGYDPNLRCYQCGERGHFSRDCRYYSRSYKRYDSRSRSRSRSRPPRNSRSRSRSPSRKRRYTESRSRSRSFTPKKEDSRRSKRRSDSGSPRRDTSPSRRLAEIEKSGVIIDSA
uniref:Serine/arginine-rich splicing factor 7-like isoform X2 n=1 Tax=Saccoglossus kowalevskii TaxID=10224 RepID=A0ABM0M9W4_SACKO|nr:PREDICTED: serine/arginine-rich splicing factor 7-like isoform X2 [Saccoglossus kowalevskii]